MSLRRVGIDIGGTFTDLILQDTTTGQVLTHKVPSTPPDQSIGVVKGLEEICRRAGIEPAQIDSVVHGTTVATNIMIEHDGAEVGMITTRGFRDILHIARHKRPHNFSLMFELPWQTRPLVRRRNRKVVTERVMPPDGRIEVPLAEEEVRQAARELAETGVEAVVVAFIYSFLNPRHEVRAKEIVLEEFPSAYVSTSTEVIPQIREYERFSTVAMNAFTGPKTARYVRNLDEKLRALGFQGQLLIMGADGGVIPPETAASQSVQIVKSGPAGGVVGGVRCGELAGERNFITVDIGGTSADISVAPEGVARIVNPRDAQVAGFPVLVPMLDIDTVGAGGGSIAYVDPGGAFRVGPKSAGADPGPACYGRGGEEPTVTDANVVLGRLDPEHFLGGELEVFPELAARAIEAKVATRLGLSVEEAALGILRIVNNNMALSVRANSVSRGIDPRDFALVAFGGAGPLHAVALAETVMSPCVVVPPNPGIAAAMGLLMSELRHEFPRSLLAMLTDVQTADLKRINEQLEALEGEAHRQLEADGIAPEDRTLRRVAECRYVGQGFELRADVPPGRLDREKVGQIIQSFHAAHDREYAHHFDENPVELITLRVVALGRTPPLELPRRQAGGETNPAAARVDVRPTSFLVDGQVQRLDTPRLDRTKLRGGDKVEGPAIVVQQDSTTLIPPGYRAVIDEQGILVVRRLQA